MTLEVFTKMIEAIQGYDKTVSAAYKLGIDLLNLNDDYQWSVVSPLMFEVFGVEGVEMIEWFLYERKDNWEKEAATDKDGNPICYDIPSLYEFATSK